MSCDVLLLIVQPASRNDVRIAGTLTVREVGFSGQYVRAQKCLDIEVETQPENPPIMVSNRNTQVPAVFKWLTLEAEIWTTQTPRRQIGRVVIPELGMLPIGSTRHGPAKWQWAIAPEDAEAVERMRAVQPGAPLYFEIEIRGTAKIMGTGGETASIEALRSGAAPHLVIEHSQWERLLGSLEYTLPPSHVSLAGRPALDHPSWSAASKALEPARQHHRLGEDYDALRRCLSALEALVHAPYNAASWQERLGTLPQQKANGVAELLSGLATYCNRIGHHRDRAERDSSGDLHPMPLDHWEADLVLGAAQFLLTYAIRLRQAGILRDAPLSDGKAAAPKKSGGS